MYRRIEQLNNAIYDGHLARVAEILESGHDPSLRQKYGPFALHVAARQNHVEIATLLLDHGAKLDAVRNRKTALHVAVLNQAFDTATLLLDRGADVDAGAYKHTPLHFAAKYGHKREAILLLDRGAKIHAEDEENMTPLHYAVSRADTEMICLLVEYGASLLYKPSRCCTPYESAQRRLQFSGEVHKERRQEVVQLVEQIVSTQGTQEEFYAAEQSEVPYSPFYHDGLEFIRRVLKYFWK